MPDTTKDTDFEVGDRVRLKFRAGHECDGRMATVKGPQGTDGLVPVELDRSPYNTSVQRVRPIRLNNP